MTETHTYLYTYSKYVSLTRATFTFLTIFRQINGEHRAKNCQLNDKQQHTAHLYIDLILEIKKNEYKTSKNQSKNKMSDNTARAFRVNINKRRK